MDEKNGGIYKKCQGYEATTISKSASWNYVPVGQQWEPTRCIISRSVFFFFFLVQLYFCDFVVRDECVYIQFCFVRTVAAMY